MVRGYGEVKCKFCQKWQRCVFQHADEESFLATAPYRDDVAQECTNLQCRQTIEPDSANVRWRPGDAARREPT
jgi:hypothetical protein